MHNLKSTTDISSVARALEWVRRKMLTEPEGQFGMYERWRIDKGERTNWVRPDCNMEMVRALLCFETMTGSQEYAQLGVGGAGEGSCLASRRWLSLL